MTDKECSKADSLNATVTWCGEMILQSGSNPKQYILTMSPNNTHICRNKQNHRFLLRREKSLRDVRALQDIQQVICLQVKWSKWWCAVFFMRHLSTFTKHLLWDYLVNNSTDTHMSLVGKWLSYIMKEYSTDYEIIGKFHVRSGFCFSFIWNISQSVTYILRGLVEYLCVSIDNEICYFLTLIVEKEWFIIYFEHMKNNNVQ